jgi:hypothetical protein
MRRLLGSLFGLVVLATFAAQPIAAAKPVMETDVFDVTEATDICPFDVTVHAYGHIRMATYIDKSGDVVRRINNYAIHATYTANGKTVSVVNVGPDRLRFNADGSFTLAITGNIELVGKVSGEAGQTLYLFTPTGEVDEDDNPIFDVEILKVAGARPGGNICSLLAA